MRAKQLSIFLENRPDVLARLCKHLATKDINIRGMSVNDAVDHAVVRLIVDDPIKALHLLGDRGALVVETDVLAVKLTNEPMALGRVAEALAKRKINIEYAYGSSNGDHAMVYLRVSDLAKAEKALARET